MPLQTALPLHKDEPTSPKAAPNPGEIQSHIEPSSRIKSYWKAFVLIGIVVSFYAITFLGSVSPWWWVRIIAAISNGMSIGMLFIIGHDACHSCLTPSRTVDHWIARFVFMPPLWSNECWKVGHNYIHHGYTCIKDIDYTWQPVSLSEYQQMPKWRQWVERFYKSFPGVGLNWIVEIWFKHGIVPRKFDWTFLKKKKLSLAVDYALLLGFLALEICVAGYLHVWFMGESNLSTFLTGVLFGVLIPFLFWSIFVGVVVLTQHTHPRIVWYKNRKEWSFFAGSIQDTVHFRFPFPINKLYLDVMEHNVHHADPTIPIYNLVEQQKRMEEAYPDDIIVTEEDFTFATIRKIFDTCQLYDFDRHCWLKFDGTPTTKPIKLDHNHLRPKE